MAKTLHPAQFILRNENKYGNLVATLEAFPYGNGWRSKKTVTADDTGNSRLIEEGNGEFDSQWESLVQCGEWMQELLDRKTGWKVVRVKMDGLIQTNLTHASFK